MQINKLISYFALLSLCIFLAGCSSTEEKKERYYLKALEYLKQDNQKAAIIELKNAIQLDAKYADARYQLGLIYLKENNAKGAFSELIRAADLDRENLDANLKSAELYLVTRKREESRKYVVRVLEKDAKNVDASALLANLELMSGNYDKALAALANISEKVEISDKLLNIKGRVFWAQEIWDEAEQALQKAIEVNSTSFENYNNLLSFYRHRKAKDKVKTLLFEMAEKFPDLVQTHLLLAGYYRTVNDKANEEQSLKKVVSLAPDSDRHRLMLSSFYKDTNNTEAAELVLIEARKDIVDSPDLGIALATFYFDAQNYDRARNVLDEVIASTPDHQGVKLLEAKLLLKQREVQGAIEVLEKLNKEFPRWSEPYYYLGLARFSLGEVDLAQFAVATAIETNRKNDRYHTLMAELFLVQGAFVDAGKEAATALKLNPRNLRAALLFADSLLGSKDYEQAHNLLIQLNEKITDNPEILSRLAGATLGKNDREGGVALLRQLLVKVPGNNRAVLLLLALEYRNDIAGAERFVHEQIAQAPENSGLQLILGDLFSSQEKDEEALVAYEKAIELDPNNSKAYVAAGRLMVKLDKSNEAVAKYKAMIKQNKNWLQGYMGLATLLESEGKHELAREQYLKALEIKPDFAPAANNLSWLIASDPNGDLGEALRLAMIAKQAYPNEPYITDTLGWVHYKRGSPTLAIPQFEQALESKPGDPTISYHLALAVYEDGQKEKAESLLKTILEGGADFAKKDEAAQLLKQLSE